MKAFSILRLTDYRVRLTTGVIEVQHVSGVDPNDEDWILISDLDTDFFRPAFEERHPFNLPGPFYAAETDTCGTGPCEAPNNILLDRNGQEFVWKQPCNNEELTQIISAAWCECFCGYGSGGDSNWTLPLIRDWWRSRTDLLAQADHLQGDPEGITKWKKLLSGEAEQYLRAYAFYVEERRPPSEADILPSIS